MKNLFDAIISCFGLIVLSFPLLILALLVKFTSKGPVIYWSKRIGRNNMVFKMAKFRTMHINTPQIATHLLKNPEKFLTPIGKFLRRYSLDELPQLYNILRGDLSFVGPRPALFNQDDLVRLRTQKKIHWLKPGLTGWAQINGRDELPIPVKVAFDEYYRYHASFLFDIKIIFLTIIKACLGEGVSH